MNQNHLACEEVWLWNGKDRLPGSLALYEDRLIYRPRDFSESGLKLEIFLTQIKRIESLLVFDVSRLGIQVSTLDGMVNKFVIHESDRFYKLLSKQWKKCKSNA